MTVAVTVPADSDVTVDPVSLTFTESTWETAQRVTVTAEEDADAVPDELVEIAQSASGGDYGSVRIAAVEVTIEEDDAPGVRVSPRSFTVMEGSTVEYAVVLLTAPSAAVTVTATPPADSDVSVNPSSLIFTASDWNRAQAVTVTAGEDDDAEPDERVEITHGASGGDYVSVEIAAVGVTITEKDVRGVEVSPRSLTISEGETATYSVKLGSEPATDVVLNVGGGSAVASRSSTSARLVSGSDVSVSPPSLTFTPADWAAWQEVTVSTVDDADEVADATETVGHRISGGSYGTQSIPGVAVTIVELDAPHVWVEGASVSEAGGEMVFEVHLGSRRAAAT